MQRLAAVVCLIALSLLAGCAALRPPSGPFFGGRGACARPASFTAAAMANTDSLNQMAWSPFGRPEHGWAIYALRIQREIKTGCAPQTAGFAQRLAIWQGAHALPPSGVLDPASFGAMKALWQTARPYVVLRAAGVCPDPPPDAALAPIRASDVFPGKTVLLRKTAMRSLHRMLSAAWADAPGAGHGPNKLLVFSGFRSPAYDASIAAQITRIKSLPKEPDAIMLCSMMPGVVSAHAGSGMTQRHAWAAFTLWCQDLASMARISLSAKTCWGAESL